MNEQLDQRVRLAAFQWLRAQMDVTGEVLPRLLLAEGFVLDGERVPLLGPQRIFKPRMMTEAPLSITGMHDRPIYLPREVSLQPDRDRIEERYAAFLRT